MPLPPYSYAQMLGDLIRRHSARVWLVNTGWTGGPYGSGSRIKLRYTRAMVNAAIEGRLVGVETYLDPVFGLAVPSACPDVPDALLQPRATWDDESGYDAQAKHLAQMFRDNFRAFGDLVDAEVREAGPKV